MQIKIIGKVPDNYGSLKIEADGEAIGELTFHRINENTAQFGLEIREAHRNKGFGSETLRIFIRELFTQHGYERIILDVAPDNAHARYIYEKLGFRRVGADSVSALYYELTPQSFFEDRQHGNGEYAADSRCN